MLTRRELVIGAGAALAVPGIAVAGRRDRVAIIGAGAGGVTAAYFLAGTHDVEVFEARSRIGGHCDSRTIDAGRRRVTVDLGAQFFHPDTHPLYVALLEEVGLTEQIRASPGSLCVFPVRGGRPAFTSTRPLETLPAALGFASFTQEARRAVLTDLKWEVTVDAWIASLPLEPAFVRDVLYPWITATIGCSRADAARVSARSILQTFALAFPADPASGAQTYNSKIGLQGNLERLLRRAPQAKVRRNAPARSLERRGDGWYVRTPSGRHGPYRYVVLNAPPRIGRDLLRGHDAVRSILGRYRYFDSRLVIHRDPAYVHAQRAHWTAYNAGVAGRESEGSAWLGALQGDTSVDVFKSWATRRRSEPERILLERRFKHPLITPQAIAAARALRPHQGRHGLFFSGAYTTGTDLQETAVSSALQVARALAPAGPKLVSYERRLAAKGLSEISYDL